MESKNFVLLLESSRFFFKLFSPCSGLVISGYSKRIAEKWLNTDLAKAMIPYKKFKKMYTVDKSTPKFKGKKEDIHIVI